MSRYKDPRIKELRDQLRFAPVEVRLIQIDRAEEYLSELDPTGEYAYRDLCQRVTGYRSERFPGVKLPGDVVIHDLRCLIEDWSESANISVEQVDEPVYTVQELSDKYNVSTKTVDRWRNRGLVSRRFLFGKRKRVGFLESSVERFVKTHRAEVERGRNFSQMSDEERSEIVRRARRLARHGGCPADVCLRVAKKLQRSQETIRYTLKQFDRQNPGNEVFPDATDRLTSEQKREIFRNFRRGVPVPRLADQYRRTKNSIYRVVSEERARRLVEQPIDLMDSEEFRSANAKEIILGPPPEVDRKPIKAKAPPGLPPYLASLYSVPLLTREEEVYYFRKMNYLKHQAAQRQRQLNPREPKKRIMDSIEQLLDESLDIKNFLIRSNLRLVVSIAKRHIKPTSNFFEMVSDGNMSLIRAIEKFDYTKGNKFSTYATWAIMKNFARSIPAESTLLDRFRTGKEEVFQQSPDDRGNQFQDELVNQRQHQLIMGILDRLDDREKDIIILRFGLSDGSEPMTLEQVGRQFGVTKERIRQLEARGLRKMRKIAHEEKLDIPGL